MLRAAYSRTFETPFNENLLLSSATGGRRLAENVFGAKASYPIEPGFRNQFNAGLQQKIGHWLVFDADYFWKFTHNAYDFDVLFNTPITFPIAWHNSKIDGVTGRVSTINLHGFQASTTFGHTRARYFPPEDGGLIFQGPQTCRACSASITTRLSSRPPTCATSTARTGCGARSSGATTAAWWSPACRIRPRR